MAFEKLNNLNNYDWFERFADGVDVFRWLSRWFWYHHNHRRHGGSKRKIDYAISFFRKTESA